MFKPKKLSKDKFKSTKLTFSELKEMFGLLFSSFFVVLLKDFVLKF